MENIDQVIGRVLTGESINRSHMLIRYLMRALRADLTTTESRRVEVSQFLTEILDIINDEDIQSIGQMLDIGMEINTQPEEDELIDDAENEVIATQVADDVLEAEISPPLERLNSIHGNIRFN